MKKERIITDEDRKKMKENLDHYTNHWKKEDIENKKTKMKKVINFIMICMILGMCMGIASAFEFDNFKSYNEETRTITIINAFNLPLIGETIGEATLITPDLVRVGLGHQKIAEIITTSYQDYPKAIKEIKSYDVNKNYKEISRTYYYKYKTYENVSVNDYKTIPTLNGTSTKQILIGSHIERREVWKDLDSLDLKQGDNLTIGIFTNVQEGDYVEWIPEIFGRSINEWAFFSASIDVGIVAHYPTNETSGTNLADYLGFDDNGTLVNTPTWLGNSLEYDGVDQYTNLTNLGNTLDGTNAVSFAFNFTPNNLAGIQSIFADYDDWIIRLDNKDTLYFYTSGTGTGICETDWVNVSLGKSLVVGINYTWVFVMNTTGVYNWLDGEFLGNKSCSATGTYSADNTAPKIGVRDPAGTTWHLNGSVGQLTVWNRSLNDEEAIEITRLINFTSVNIPPTITLNTPVIGFNSTSQTLNFNGTVTDTDGLANVSLIINETYNELNSSGINATNYLFEEVMDDGDHNWTYEACDTLGLCANATVRIFTIDTAPTITVLSPTNTTYTNPTIFFNATASLGVTDWIVNYNGSNVTLSAINTTLEVEDGTFNLLLYADNSVSGVFGLNASVNFTVDATLPTINISDPIDETSYVYQIYNDNFNLNVTAIDTNLDTCWYEYNLTNTSYTCATGVQQNETFNITNQSDILVWVNDTSGNLNRSSVSWNYGLFDFNDYTYDSTITESSQTTFIGNFQTNISISSASLEYNNTNYSASINSLGGNIYTLSRIVTSTSVTADTNISWNFWVNDINATSFNQTVFNIELDDCSAHSNITIYYYLKDELDQTMINNSNSTIESLVYLRTLEGETVAQFNTVFEGNSTPQVCSEINLTDSGLRLWEQSRYGSDDYVFEQHNVQNASMVTFANFTLLDLPSTSATTFRITYRSETFLPVTDAVINIQRKYIGEGIFKSIESPITDANGELSASLDLDAVIYRIIVSQNGTTLSTFENPAIACQNILTGDCTINLNERQTINLITNIDIINDFNYGLTQDNRTITLTFEIPSGIARSINLFVNQSTILGNQTSCNQTTFATSGQLQCVIDPTLGDVFATAEVSSDGTLITTASTTILEDRSKYFGTDNIVLTFFLVLSLVLLMVSDPIAVLIGILIGLISGGLMLFLNAGSLFGITSILMYLIIIIIILIIKISNRQR